MLFNPITILKMAHLSSLIYCSKQYPITLTSSFVCQSQPNEKIVYFNENKTTSVKMAISQNDRDKHVSIIFRGSETITDWKYNLQFLPKSLDKDHKKFWVHTGVHKQIYPNFDFYSNITEAIVQKVPEYDIYFTGHSSAAIQALLMAYLYSERTGREVNTIGFCGPPFMNWKFRDHIESAEKIDILRVTHGLDPIPFLMMPLYTHVGNNLHLRQTYNKRRFPRIFSVKDHLILNVIRSLKNN